MLHRALSISSSRAKAHERIELVGDRLAGKQTGQSQVIPNRGGRGWLEWGFMNGGLGLETYEHHNHPIKPYRPHVRGGPSHNACCYLITTTHSSKKDTIGPLLTLSLPLISVHFRSCIRSFAGSLALYEKRKQLASKLTLQAGRKARPTAQRTSSAGGVAQNSARKRRIHVMCYMKLFF